jgi:hypothetical protein
MVIGLYVEERKCYEIVAINFYYLNLNLNLFTFYESKQVSTFGYRTSQGLQTTVQAFYLT